MKEIHLAIFLVAAISLIDGRAQESGAALVAKLQGQAGKPLTRSLTGAPSVKTTTRSVVVRTRGRPIEIEYGKVDSPVRVEPLSAPAAGSPRPTPTPTPTPAVPDAEPRNRDELPAYTISYAVDPLSQVTRQSIRFQVDSTKFADAASVLEIEKLAVAFRDPKLAGHRFAIEGHSSADGAEVRNQQLSQARAEAIVARLTGLGVDPGMLIAVGFGESQCKHAESADDSLRAQDRRVEIFRLMDR